jgi:peptidyl-prolyl cis-trans isomerase A (cyclophilin A)
MKSTITGLLALLACAAVAAQAPADRTAKLRSPAALAEKAPETYKAKFDTSKGAFVIEVHRDWAPRGADRFYNLVKNGFYDNVRFFRVVDGFMAQVGMNGTPSIQAVWDNARFPDDPVKQSNKKGYVSFASAGANTRTTQFFISLGNNDFLDKPGACGPGCAFPPFGQVVSGMDVVDQLYNGYGDAAPRGRGPEQQRIRTEGNAYLTKSFPKLDYVKTATIE